MDPILIPTWIATIMMTYSSTVADFRQNAKYSFVIDTDHTVIVMNSQTGKMWRCEKDLKCEEPKE